MFLLIDLRWRQNVVRTKIKSGTRSAAKYLKIHTWLVEKNKRNHIELKFHFFTITITIYMCNQIVTSEIRE